MSSTLAASAPLRIEAVAQRTGLTKRTIRYYEELGLVTPSGRSDGGYRLYTEDDVVRLERIARLRDLAGLSLAEIHELLEAESVRDRLRRRYHSAAGARERHDTVVEAAAVLRRQVALIARKREALATLQADYEERLERLGRLAEELATDAETGR